MKAATPRGVQAFSASAFRVLPSARRQPKPSAICHLPSAKFSLGTLALAVLLGEILGRAMGLGALGPAKTGTKQVALTFDDGPSERTMALLEVLARHGAKATFFVTEPACRQFPAELEAIRAAGHQLEAHGRWHRHALMLTPWREWQQIAWHPRANERGPHLYRPPYGGHSPLTRLLAWRLGRQVALWDTEGRDWTAATTTEFAAELAAQTLERTKTGSIVLLHDGPEVTPPLLDKLLLGLRERGWQAVTLNDLPPSTIGWRDGWRRIWQSYGK